MINDQITVKKGEKCPTCGQYYSREINTDALIIKEGKILLILRDHEPFKGFWALVGGYLSWGETLEQCAIREVKEEIGVNAKIVKQLGIYSDPNRTEVSNIAIPYLVEVESENFKPQPGEVKDIKWFPLDNLPENIAFDHRKIIEDCLKSQ